jgi:hypothetical protein
MFSQVAPVSELIAVIVLRAVYDPYLAFERSRRTSMKRKNPSVTAMGVEDARGARWLAGEPVAADRPGVN